MSRACVLGFLVGALGCGGTGVEGLPREHAAAETDGDARVRDETAAIQALLSRLPAIGSVDATVDMPKPAQVIFHILDWHLVGRDAFASDLRDADASLDDEAIDRSYRDHVAAVEDVQRDERAVLAALIRQQSTAAVLQEGLTDRDLPAYRAQVSVLKDASERLAAAAAEREKIGGNQPDLDAAIGELRRWRRTEMLRIGASGQLLMEGLLTAVHPLEDEGAYEAANPLRADGSFAVDEEANEAREDAQVRRALAHGRYAVIVLGGAHDLSDNVRRIAPATCAYVRIETRAYRRVNEE